MIDLTNENGSPLVEALRNLNKLLKDYGQSINNYEATVRIDITKEADQFVDTCPEENNNSGIDL